MADYLNNKSIPVVVLLSVIGYFAYVVWGGWNEVVVALKQVPIDLFLILLLLSLVNYFLRFLRWQYYLGLLDHTVPWKPSMAIYFSGLALTVSPGKAGELWRSLLLKPYGVGVKCSVSAFLSERLSDLIAMVILCSVGLGVTSKYLEWISLVFVGLVIFLVVMHWFPQVPIFQRCSKCFRMKSFFVGTFLGVIAWGAEALALYLLVLPWAPEITLAHAVFIYSVSTLLGALTFLPGGLGGTEVLLTGFLLLEGISKPMTVALTIVIRIATLWFAVMVGLVGIVAHQAIEQRRKSKA